MDFDPFLIYKLRLQTRIQQELAVPGCSGTQVGRIGPPTGAGQHLSRRMPFTFSLISSMKPARFGRRYIAFLLDILFLEILGTLVTLPLVNQSELNLAKIVIRWAATGRISVDGALLVALYTLMMVLVWGLYFVGFTAACGQTPGKKILGLWVTDEDGGPVSWGAASIRCFIGYPLSLLPLGLGFYWALVDRNNQAWHDKIAGTRVIGPATS